MTLRTETSCALAVGVLMTCAPIFAHHATTSYDTSKVVVLKRAIVTKFIWTNPHIAVLFDVKDAKGNVQHWAAEAGSTAAARFLGWSRNSMKPGDSITVYIYQAKNGKPVGRLNKIVLADGTELKDSVLGRQDVS